MHDPSSFLVPPDLWDRPQVVDALTARDVGLLLALVQKFTGASQQTIGSCIDMAQSEVSKYKAGKRVATDLTTFERIAAGLGMPDRSRMLLGIAPTPRGKRVDTDPQRAVSELTSRWTRAEINPHVGNSGQETGEVSPTRRRDLLMGGGAGMLLASRLRDEADAMHVVLDTGTVGAERLDYFEATAAQLGLLAVKVDPASLLDVTLDHFRSVRKLLASRQRTPHELRLLRVAAQYATVIGEILFVQGAFAEADRWYQVAQRAALEAGDRYLADIALAGETYLSFYSDDPGSVIEMVAPRLAKHHSKTPAIAWLWAAQARAFAALGQTSDFRRSIERSNEALEGSPESDIKPGIFSFLSEKAAFYEAHGCVRLNDGAGAISAADRALQMYDLTETTEPALAQFEKASGLVLEGEIEQSLVIAISAVNGSHTYHGVTVRGRAHAFNRLFDKERGLPAVVEWRAVLADIEMPEIRSEIPGDRV